MGTFRHDVTHGGGRDKQAVTVYDVIRGRERVKENVVSYNLKIVPTLLLPPFFLYTLFSAVWDMHLFSLNVSWFHHFSLFFNFILPIVLIVWNKGLTGDCWILRQSVGGWVKMCVTPFLMALIMGVAFSAKGLTSFRKRDANSPKRFLEALRMAYN